ncbi:hybrid sensor histidine kinase/response regulator [Rhodoferax ferrireducens]|uniref:hybrid sensor histidine kinase/response regulator n=1 Tax=Rhodoferax ferrireducens TaxID=192843 RepID=UPI000E0DFAA2|nr:hybrid sensor histidine kinase/response regulator [Rhodoferax ferrireducens]
MAIDVKKFIIRFVEEARDHIHRLHGGLTALEAGSADPESINAIFRSAHTIKGSSRMLKLGPITETAHKLEDVMEALRAGQLQFSPLLGQLLYRAVDALAALVDKLAETSDSASLPPADASLCEALAQAALGKAAEVAAPVPAPALAIKPVASLPVPAPEVKLKTAETVRVRLSKLDELIKLMGEVVSSHARMRQRLVDVRGIERELVDSAADPHAAASLHRFAQTLKDDVQAQEVLMDELHDKTLLMRMLPLAIVFEPAARMVRELARSVGKQVECVVTGAEIELDRQMIDKLSDPIIHLIRNGIDHGLESPEKRTAAGKAAQGRLSLSARQDGGWVVIEVSDDGGGIALAAVRDKAVKKGFVSAEKAAAMADQEVIDLIFLPGFSTNNIITDLSGRGVGMDVVKQCILDDLQGSVSVETRPGAGTTFALRLPLSLAVMRVLLVEVNGLPFGFTAQYVAELLRVPHEAQLKVAERKAVIIRNEFVPLVPLAELLHIPAHRARPHAVSATRAKDMLLLVLRVRNEKIAVQVDDLLDERDMVIKPLPEHLRKLPMVSGMVTTGKNELVGVLHAPALLEAARRIRHAAVRAGDETPAVARPYNVLVVDDSLNTREIEKDVLEAYGYRVTLAEDGLDGLRKAMDGDFDAILTDVEMPHMDGFSLTARLRQEEKYLSTPIVIITSREKEEDKQRGVQVGADAYIVKGDFDQNRLVDTLRALLG